MIIVVIEATFSLMATLKDTHISINWTKAAANTSYNNAHHCTNGSNQLPQFLYSVSLVVESN